MRKKILSALSAAVCLSLLASCGTAAPVKPDKTKHKIEVRMAFDCDGLTATFRNSANGKSQTVEAEKETDGSSYDSYVCWGDADAYNKVFFTYNGNNTEEVAFNEMVSGWYISSFGVIPCTPGVEDSDTVDYKVETFTYNNDTKDVFIWTPPDYDANSADKYAVIYLLDGQWMFDRHTSGSGSWNVAESVTGMTAQTGNKAIIVAIETPEVSRSSELTPDFGETKEKHDAKYSQRDGRLFAEFVYETIVPFVEKNYNVCTDPAHNSIAGSSLGGMESFFIGMEYPDKFGTIGALSPAFGLYDMSVWENYISEKKLDGNRPFVYLYAGGNNDNEWSARKMKEVLLAASYPEDKIAIDVFKYGAHLLPFWRAIFPEFLEAMFLQSVPALKNA